MIANLRPTARFLAFLEIWVVGSAVAASILSARFLLVAIVIAAFFWLVRWFACQRLTLRTPADWAVILLLLMLPVTLWVTAIPATTIPQVYRLLTGVAIYYAIVNWTFTSSRLRWLRIGIIGMAFVLALSALVSVNWPIDKFSALLTPIYNHFALLASDPVNPNVMAGSLVILLPLPLAWLIFGWNGMGWSVRLVLGVTVLTIVVILGLTLSRGAWIAFGVILIILALLRWKWSWVVIVGVAVAGISAVYWLGVAPVLNALFTNTTLGGMDVRIEVWSRALYMIQDFPFTGIGMGNFGAVADAIYPFFLAAPGKIPHAHNLFLQVAVDLGIPGLIAWLGILLTVGFVAWNLYRRARSEGDLFWMGLGAGLLCSQVAIAVHGLTDAVTWGMVRSAPIVWVLWGVVAAAWNIYSSKTEDQKASITDLVDCQAPLLTGPTQLNRKSPKIWHFSDGD